MDLITTAINDARFLDRFFTEDHATMTYADLAGAIATYLTDTTTANSEDILIASYALADIVGFEVTRCTTN